MALKSGKKDFNHGGVSEMLKMFETTLNKKLDRLFFEVLKDHVK